MIRREGMRKGHETDPVNRVSDEKQTQDTHEPLCLHRRMVTYHRDKDGSPTGNLICRECRAVFPDPLKTIG